MGSEARRDRLRRLIEPVVAAEGLDLEDVTITPAGRRRLLRVVVDKDGGVDLEHIAEVSRLVSKTLDAHDDALGSGPYVLEVTSPGVDRPLTLPRHWRRARGRLVKVDTVTGASFEGRVLAADDTGAELNVAGTTRRVEYQEVARARVQVEFRRHDDVADDDGVDDGDEG